MHMNFDYFKSLETRLPDWLLEARDYVLAEYAFEVKGLTMTFVPCGAKELRFEVLRDQDVLFGANLRNIHENPTYADLLKAALTEEGMYWDFGILLYMEKVYVKPDLIDRHLRAVGDVAERLLTYLAEHVLVREQELLAQPWPFTESLYGSYLMNERKRFVHDNVAYLRCVDPIGIHPW